MMYLRRSVAVISVVLLACSWCTAATRTVTIPFVPKGPVLDGDLGDSVWSKAPLLKGFVGLDEKSSITQQTEARVLYDSQYVYLGIRCAESNLAGVAKFAKEHDGAVWQDDCIELLFDTANGHHTVYHVIVNSIGTVYDEKCMDTERALTTWQSGAKVKAGKAQGAWTLEIAIPAKEMGISLQPGLVWGLNVCRARYAGAKEYSSWSPTPGGFVQPKNLGHIVFGDRTGKWTGIQVQSWGNLDSDTSYGGRNVMECMVPNRGRAKTSYDVVLKSGAAVLGRSKVTLAGGESFTVEIPYKPVSPKESYTLTVSSGGKQVFQSAHPSMSVPATPRVWQLQDPLFKELLSTTPPGEQKNGTIYWFHSGVESRISPLAKEYGLRFSLDEAYRELADARFMPITQIGTIKGDLLSQMASKYPFKVLFQPDYRFSRDKGAPQIDGLPFALDPRSKESYFNDLREGIAKGRTLMWAVYTQDELHEKTAGQGMKFRTRMWDSYPFIREVDERVRLQFGYGKYGMPESPTDENPFRWIAYHKYINKQLLDWQKQTYETTKQLAPELKVVSMDPIAGHNPVDMDKWSPYVDIVTHQLYPSGNPNRQEFGFVTKWVADLTGKPVWPCAHVENYAYSVTAEETRELMSQVMRNGGKGFHLYIPDVKGVGANSGDTLLTKYGCPERYRAIREILDTTYRMNEVAVPDDPDCAILYSEDHYQSFPAKDYVYPNEPEWVYTFLGPVARTWFKFVNDNMIEDSKVDLGKYKAVFVPAAKYERRAVVEKLLAYVQNGGVLVLGNAECFSFAPDGSSLSDLQHKLMPESLPKDSVVRKSVGKGKVIVFTNNPFTEANVGDEKWKSTFKALAKELGLKTDRDIWRFKFPEFKSVYQPDPTGVCLTGNYIKWHQERPLDICNATISGKYSYSLAPDGIADRDGAFGVGKLTDREKAPSVPKIQLKPEDFIVTWKTEKPVDVTFDLGKPYPVRKVSFWYSDQLPTTVVFGSTDGKSWERLGNAGKKPATSDVLDQTFGWGYGNWRFIRLSFGPRDPGQAMTLVECEVWAM